MKNSHHIETILSVQDDPTTRNIHIIHWHWGFYMGIWNLTQLDFVRVMEFPVVYVGLDD